MGSLFNCAIITISFVARHWSLGSSSTVFPSFLSLMAHVQLISYSLNLARCEDVFGMAK